MPFKGIHGHTRHTHEDKVKEKRKSEEKDRPPKNIKKEQQSAVKDEVDLYNTPFEPFAPQNTAHYVNRFFRRAAQTVVHCVLALSPHFYIHTDELFDWMMPYERMGALLSEDAADYIAREKAKLELVEKEQNCTEKMECLNISEEGEDDESDCDNDSDNESENESESDCESEAMQLYAEHMQQQMQQMQQPQIQPQQQQPQQQQPQQQQQQQQQYSTSFSTTSSMDCPLSDITSHVSAPNHRYCVSPKHVSSIFSSHATNPHTDEDVQVDPKHPDKPVQPMVSHFHPPFLIVDCRRADEYTESHIHGAMNIHYVLPKGPDFIPGERLTFKLPDWVEYDTPIITYCAVGLRSGMMVWELRRRGYKLVKALSGGYYKWVNEGRPIYANSGELTQKVLQQHKLAGIMLRKELKAMQRKERNKEMQDARVAIHHEHDTDFPPCHTYGPCAGKSNMKKVQNKQAKRMKKEGKEKIAGRRRSSIQQMERKNMWEHRHSIIMDEPPKQSLSERSNVKFSTPVSGENENTKEGQRRVSWRERHSLPGGSSSM